MTNAFTQKPDTSWLKKQERNRKVSTALSKVTQDPTKKQRQRLANLLEKK